MPPNPPITDNHRNSQHKTMNKYIITCLGLVLGTHAAMADDAWSLQQCVDYALANNISVRSSALQAENADLDVTAAKDAFLPTVSASASEGFNFGRGLTSENIYANRNTSNFQWGLSMSVPLFQGLGRKTAESCPLNPAPVSAGT